jgi:D-alanine-D-alanine ligase-like ATP-grasp enzyme
LRVIHFLTTTRHRYTFDEIVKALPQVQVHSYEKVLQGGDLPPGRYVFSDVDRLNIGAQILAAKLFRSLQAQPAKYRVLNDPARVKLRFGLLRTLWRLGCNSFDVYRADEGASPRRFPVFLRHEHEHKAPLSDLLRTQAELDAALQRLIDDGKPARTILVVEYRAEPAAPGLFRKLAAYRVGDRIVPANTVHDNQWCVKYGKTGGGTEALYADELELIQSNRYEKALRPVFEAADIEYGRVDFGLCEGKVEVYEINTNPNITLPSPQHPSATRVRSERLVWEGLLAAISALDFEPASVAAP